MRIEDVKFPQDYVGLFLKKEICHPERIIGKDLLFEGGDGKDTRVQLKNLIRWMHIEGTLCQLVRSLCQAFPLQ